MSWNAMMLMRCYCIVHIPKKYYKELGLLNYSSNTQWSCHIVSLNRVTPSHCCQRFMWHGIKIYPLINPGPQGLCNHLDMLYGHIGAQIYRLNNHSGVATSCHGNKQQILTWCTIWPSTPPPQILGENLLTVWERILTTIWPLFPCTFLTPTKRETGSVLCLLMPRLPMSLQETNLKFLHYFSWGVI